MNIALDEEIEKDKQNRKQSRISSKSKKHSHKINRSPHHNRKGDRSRDNDRPRRRRSRERDQKRPREQPDRHKTLIVKGLSPDLTNEELNVRALPELVPLIRPALVLQDPDRRIREIEIRGDSKIPRRHQLRESHPRAAQTSTQKLNPERAIPDEGGSPPQMIPLYIMPLKDFKVISRLGEGSFSKVYKVVRLSDDTHYAMKRVDLSQLSKHQQQDALNQVRILASIDCEHVISYKQAFLDRNALCIVMEIAAGGDLKKVINKYRETGLPSQQMLWTYTLQITKGLKSLHDRNVIHCDLKSANIFLTSDGICKLGDMNVSKVTKNGQIFVQTGTPYYASPEVWRHQPYDFKSDIWSLGVILYQLTTGRLPFQSSSIDKLNYKIQKGEYSPLSTKLSDDFINLVDLCLSQDPFIRPSCGQILSNKRFIQLESPHSYSSIISSKLLDTIRLDSAVGVGPQLPQPKYQNEKTINNQNLLKFLRESDPIRRHQNIKKTELSRRPQEIKKSRVVIQFPQKTNQKSFHLSSENQERLFQLRDLREKKEAQQWRYYRETRYSPSIQQSHKRKTAVASLSPPGRCQISNMIQDRKSIKSSFLKSPRPNLHLQKEMQKSIFHRKLLGQQQAPFFPIPHPKQSQLYYPLQIEMPVPHKEHIYRISNNLRRGISAQAIGGRGIYKSQWSG